MIRERRPTYPCLLIEVPNRLGRSGISIGTISLLDVEEGGGLFIKISTSMHATKVIKIIEIMIIGKQTVDKQQAFIG